MVRVWMHAGGYFSHCPAMGSECHKICQAVSESLRLLWLAFDLSCDIFWLFIFWRASILPKPVVVTEFKSILRYVFVLIATSWPLFLIRLKQPSVCIPELPLCVCEGGGFTKSSGLVCTRTPCKGRDTPFGSRSWEVSTCRLSLGIRACNLLFLAEPNSGGT